MGQPTIDQTWINFYDGAFRQHVHQLLAWGYTDARHQIDQNKLEEDITGFLWDAMMQRLSDSATPEFFDRYSVHNESPVRGGLGTGKRRKRLDIVMECGGGIKPRPEFMFEAKRLAKSTNTIADYVGQEGLQCYTTGAYASAYKAAGMIGYVQTNDTAYWLSELTRRFDNDTHNAFCLVTPLASAPVIADLPDEWVSEHCRQSNHSINVFHIFLDCS